MGDVFEGGADLTVLPCGAKPSWTTSVDRWIDQFGIPSPKQFVNEIHLGAVTQPFPFPGPKNITKFVAYGVSVLNDGTTPEAIQQIGENLGRLTQSNPDIRKVESVLFGTGHGRLKPGPAAKALAEGFRKAAHPDASLWIYLHGDDRVSVVRKAISGGFIQHIFDSLNLNLNFFGMGVNFKKLFKLEK